MYPQKNTDQHKRPKVVHVCAIDWTVQYLLKTQILALKQAGYDVYAMCTPDKYQQALKESGIESGFGG